jgi:formyl-CoA transferase
MVSHEWFQSLDRPEYQKNAGRINDKSGLNQQINEITSRHSTQELIELFNSLTLPISKIHGVQEVLQDPLVRRNLLYSSDEVSGTKLTLPPPPNRTPYLKEIGGVLSFPPRFGEHNEEIYGGTLGYSGDRLRELKSAGVI